MEEDSSITARRRSQCKEARTRSSSCCHSRKERKLSNYNNSTVCPVCTVTVRGDDKFEEHYNQELEKVNLPFGNIAHKKKQYKMRLRSQHKEENEEGGNEVLAKTLDERSEDLKAIRKRKYSRYADMFLVSMKRSKSSSTVTTSHGNAQPIVCEENPSSYELVSCVVCNEFLETNTSNEHLSKCFAKHDYQFELYSSDESENDETVEEFSWAGQTWLRTSSLQETPGFEEGRLTRLVMADEDEDLDIDGDTETQFGKQQFSEKDVIPCCSNGSPVQQGINENLPPNSNTIIYSSPSTSITNDRWTDATMHQGNVNIDKNEKRLEEENPNKFIELLKTKIKKLEDRIGSETYKCPICMGPYIEPVISINCWHACCSECWLRVLGAKKMCPKCNEIVTPSQLRKIFL